MAIEQENSRFCYLGFESDYHSQTLKYLSVILDANTSKGVDSTYALADNADMTSANQVNVVTKHILDISDCAEAGGEVDISCVAFLYFCLHLSFLRS